jgi:glycosyltransferase involved in cell wall biosynthesis
MGNKKQHVRVAHVVYRLEVINLMKNLSADRYVSSLYCLKEGGRLTGELEDAGFAVHELQKKDGVDYAAFIKIAKRFKHEGVDIVHCHNIGALLYGSIGGKLARTAGTLYTAHGTYSARRLANLRFGRFLSVDRIVAVSDDSRRAILNHGRYRPEDVETFPNGIDTKSFDLDVDVEEIKRELGIRENVTVLGIVARLSWEKEHKTLFDAVAQLKSNGTNVALVVIGDGPLKEDLHDYVSDAEISDAVFFLGERYDVPQLLQVLDVFVLSSRIEGMSLTLLEAMAAGLPIVATDVGGNSEVVAAGETGILIEPGNPAALAKAVEKFVSDSELARTMGERGRTRVNEIFSLEAMVKRYETVYEQLFTAA